MNVIYGKRRTGRTTELIKMCAKDEYSLIVAPNSGMCDCIFSQSKEMGYSIPKPITFDAFAKGRFYGRNVKRFYFDELLMSLKTIAQGVPIEAIVITDDESVELVHLTQMQEG